MSTSKDPWIEGLSKGELIDLEEGKVSIGKFKDLIERVESSLSENLLSQAIGTKSKETLKNYWISAGKYQVYTVLLNLMKEASIELKRRENAKTRHNK